MPVPVPVPVPDFRSDRTGKKLERSFGETASDQLAAASFLKLIAMHTSPHS